MSKLIKLFDRNQEENRAVDSLVEQANQYMYDDGYMNEIIAITVANLREDIFTGITKTMTVDQTP